MELKTTFFTRFLDWVVKKTLKEMIDYIKSVAGEAKVAADVNSFGSWSAFLLNLMRDLLEGYKQINAPATKGVAVHATPGQTTAAAVKAPCRTQTAAAIKAQV